MLRWWRRDELVMPLPYTDIPLLHYICTYLHSSLQTQPLVTCYYIIYYICTYFSIPNPNLLNNTQIPWTQSEGFLLFIFFFKSVGVFPSFVLPLFNSSWFFFILFYLVFIYFLHTLFKCGYLLPCMP